MAGEFDGNGNYIRNFTWQQHADAGIGIEPGLHDEEDDDFATALGLCITRNGQSPPSTDIPWGGHRLINLGDPAAASDAATRGFIESGATLERKTAFNMSGANANGRINFSNATGVNGIGWTNANMGLFG